MSTIIVTLGVVIVIVAGSQILLRRYRRNSPSAQAGFNPHNVTPWGAFLRQQRADAGKKDNWFTRPLIRGRDGKIEVLPKSEDSLDRSS